MQFALLKAFGHILAPSEEMTSPRLKCFMQMYLSLQRSRNGSKLEKDGCQYILKRNSQENSHRNTCMARQFPSFSRMKYKLSLSWICFWKGWKIDFRIIFFPHVFNGLGFFYLFTYACSFEYSQEKSIYFFKLQLKFWIIFWLHDRKHSIDD